MFPLNLIYSKPLIYQAGWKFSLDYYWSFLLSLCLIHWAMIIGVVVQNRVCREGSLIFCSHQSPLTYSASKPVQTFVSSMLASIDFCCLSVPVPKIDFFFLYTTVHPFSSEVLPPSECAVRERTSKYGFLLCFSEYSLLSQSQK